MPWENHIFFPSPLKNDNICVLCSNFIAPFWRKFNLRNQFLNSIFLKCQICKKKVFVLIDSELNWLQRASFWTKFFTTCQSSKRNFWFWKKVLPKSTRYTFRIVIHKTPGALAAHKNFHARDKSNRRLLKNLCNQFHKGFRCCFFLLSHFFHRLDSIYAKSGCHRKYWSLEPSLSHTTPLFLEKGCDVKETL